MQMAPPPGQEMLSRKILHRHSAGKATHYYSDQKDDYYARDGGAAQWQGQAAKALGLQGDIVPEQFYAAMRGQFSDGVDLANSTRRDAKARAALDLTFSAPKSISIQALVLKDAKVLAAHDKAVTRALDYLESELMLSRRKEHGKSRVESTGNAVIAKFRHETSRPSKYALADPQLHTHAIVMNVTQRSDGRWTAMSNERIVQSLKLLDAVYQSELAAELDKAGYALRHESGHVELAHISREQIEAFSKRSADIESELAKMGETRQTASHGLKQTVTLKTRQDKSAEISRDDLQRNWEQQGKAVALERDHARHKEGIERAMDRTANPDQPSSTTSAATAATAAARHRLATEAIRWAIKHLTEREAVMQERTLLTTAMAHAALHGVSVQEMKIAIAREVTQGHLVKGAPFYHLAAEPEGVARSRAAWVRELVAAGLNEQSARTRVRNAIVSGALARAQPHYTTQAAREREKRILQIEQDGRAKVAPILSAEQARRAMDGRNLKPGQQAAAELILSSPNRVIGVQGLAGSGKSHMLEQVKAVAEAEGFAVKAVASYGMQITALRDLGVQARTVASVLEARDTERFRLDERTVLVVDEAGVIPSRIMERLLKLAEDAGARVVLLGDTEQTKAIEAGRPFHQLQDAGMETAVMGDIVRQKDPILRQAVEHAAAGRAGAALGLLHGQAQSVKTIEDDQERYLAMAQRYANLSPDERRETLILTGTNASRNALNEAAHQALGLSGRGFDYDLLTRRDTTQAQRRQAKYYVRGDVIQPERNYKGGGLKQDELYRVLGQVDGHPNKLEVEHLLTGHRFSFNPARTTKLSVYQPVRAELSAGDWVRVTRNDAARDLVNGARFEVLGVTPTTVTIGDGDRRITLPVTSRMPLHLDRAYATTAHSAQGLTSDRVLVNAESFSRTTKQDVFYVSISRARLQAEIFTDNLDNLAGAAQRREDKTAALDIGLAPTVNKKAHEASHQMAI